MTGKRKWLWLGLLLLLGWWWWKRRSSTLVVAVETPVTPPYVAQIPPAPAPALPASSGQGSSLTMAGFAPGDVSNESLSRLADETVAMINSHNFAYSGPKGGGALLDEFWAFVAAGDTEHAEQAREQIRTAILHPT
jgi:hypothetical protein